MMSEVNNATEPLPTQNDERWAHRLVTELAVAALAEKRRTRRWGIFFKFLFLLYLVIVTLLVFSPLKVDEVGIGQRHTALVSVDGLIASGTKANAENIISGLRAAFKDDKTAGVILRINSPGGSPVQAGEVYNEIMHLRKAHPDIPIYAVASDICASGGYYIAAATQKIYANKASIIGSIGVRAGGFGFVDAIEKLGISRRLYTAGKNKAFLDPFEPQRPDDVQHIQSMLNDIYQQFIEAVRQGRGERLRETSEIFSGLVWTGEKSLELGLVDELADTRHVAEMVIGASKVVEFTKRERLIERLFEGVQATVSQVLNHRTGLNNLTAMQ